MPMRRLRMCSSNAACCCCNKYQYPRRGVLYFGIIAASAVLFFAALFSDFYSAGHTPLALNLLTPVQIFPHGDSIFAATAGGRRRAFAACFVNGCPVLLLVRQDASGMSCPARPYRVGESAEVDDAGEGNSASCILAWRQISWWVLMQFNCSSSSIETHSLRVCS